MRGFPRLKSRLLVLAAAPMLLASGCGIVPTAVEDKALQALCQRTFADRAAHADALATDGGNQSVVTGRDLIIKLDYGCEPHDPK